MIPFPKGELLLVPTSPAIRVQQLSFAYPGGRAALTDISFELAAGESVGLVGPNGAGKTTLFLCLSGVLAGKASGLQLAGLNPLDPAQRLKVTRAEVRGIMGRSLAGLLYPPVWRTQFERCRSS
ncbi:MAG: ATP-binding cassette domain-containing protein [Verrucomicrobia bacterium]|nr:ATP-binding cassette domain-containing protein [Verrucomicrobiota bacterium]